LAEDVSEETDMEEQSRTELDCHAKTPVLVLGRNVYIKSDTGRIANKNPFTPDYESMLLSIVDTAVWCNCLCNGKTCIFVVRNALSVPLMRNNLMPIFVMREAGIRANNTPKIHTIEPTEKNFSM
jgi:hypothetical protein